MTSYGRRQQYDDDSHERAFFVYDHQKHGEEADPKDAILYFYPPSVDVVEQIALVGGIIGSVDFCIEVLGYTPAVVSLTTCRFALLKTGPFILGLSSELQVPEQYVVQHLQFLWKTFCMFQGSLFAVKQRTGEDGFTLELSAIWNVYFTLCQSFSDSLSQAFGVIPYRELPVSQSNVFLQASHILQTAHHQAGVIGGVLLNRNRVLCTQLGTDITRRLLVLMPFKQNFPCIEIKPAFDLPGGVRLVCAFLTPAELSSLGPRKRAKSKHSPSHNQDNKKDNNAAFFFPSATLVSTGRSNDVTTSPFSDCTASNPSPPQPPPLLAKPPHGLPSVREYMEMLGDVEEEEEDEGGVFHDVVQSDSALLFLSEARSDGLAPARSGCGDGVEESQGEGMNRSIPSSCDDVGKVKNYPFDTVVRDSQIVVADSQTVVTDTMLNKQTWSDEVERIEDSCEQQENRTAVDDTTRGKSSIDEGCSDGDVTRSRDRNSKDEASLAEDGDADRQRGGQASSNSGDRSNTTGGSSSEKPLLDGENDNDDNSSQGSRLMCASEPLQEAVSERDARECLVSSEGPAQALPQDRTNMTHPDSSDRSARDSVSDLTVQSPSEDSVQHERPSPKEGDMTDRAESMSAQEGQPSKLLSEGDGGEENVLNPNPVHSANMDSHVQQTQTRDDDGNSHFVASHDHSGSEEEMDANRHADDLNADERSRFAPPSCSSSNTFPGSSSSPSAPRVYPTPPTLTLDNSLNVDASGSEAQTSLLCSDISTTASSNGTAAAAQGSEGLSNAPRLDSSTASDDSQAFPLQLSLLSPATQVVHFNVEPTVIGQKEETDDGTAGPAATGDVEISLKEEQRIRTNSVLTVSDDMLSPSKERLSFGSGLLNSGSSGSGGTQGQPVLPPRLLSEYSTEPSSSDIARSLENISGMSSSSTLLSSPGTMGTSGRGPWGRGDDSGLEGRQKVLLYVQGHMDTLLVLLMDDVAHTDRETVNILWKSSLAKLAELDFDVSDANGVTDEFNVGRSSYQYLKYDSASHAMAGTATKAVTSLANELVTSSTLLHDTFCSMPSSSDILCRTHTTCCYGHRNPSSETFFQVVVANGGGYPDPRDPIFTLDQLADRKLYTDHCSTLL